MTVMGFLVSISWLLVVILVLVDVITRDPSRIRHLDKTMWVIIVIIIPLIGSILWFAIGREWDQRADLGSFGDLHRARPCRDRAGDRVPRAAGAHSAARGGAPDEARNPVSATGEFPVSNAGVPCKTRRCEQSPCTDSPRSR